MDIPYQLRRRRWTDSFHVNRNNYVLVIATCETNTLNQRVE